MVWKCSSNASHIRSLMGAGNRRDRHSLCCPGALVYCVRQTILILGHLGAVSLNGEEELCGMLLGKASVPGEGAEADPEDVLSERGRRGGSCVPGRGTGRSEGPEVGKPLRCFHHMCLSWDSLSSGLSLMCLYIFSLLFGTKKQLWKVGYTDAQALGSLPSP